MWQIKIIAGNHKKKTIQGQSLFQLCSNSIKLDPNHNLYKSWISKSRQVFWTKYQKTYITKIGIKHIKCRNSNKMHKAFRSFLNVTFRVKIKHKTRLFPQSKMEILTSTTWIKYHRSNFGSLEMSFWVSEMSFGFLEMSFNLFGINFDIWEKSLGLF